MTTQTFKIGDTIVHRIIEMECGFTPALEFLPKMTPEMLADSRPWLLAQKALDDQDRLVLCFQAYIIRTGKHVILVEDILDTGLTLAYLRKLFAQQHPKSLRIATLLDKPSRRIEKIDADYVGFSIPNLFVIGYGMDYAERYRNLPDICIMAPEQPA